MTDSEKELVGRLRGKRFTAVWDDEQVFINPHGPEAADAIERLARERDEARAERDNERCFAVTEQQRAEAAEAEVASLSMQLDGARGVLKETEARAVKLHRALQSAIDMLEPVGHDDDTPEQAKIDWNNDLASLRAALEAKHD